MSIFIFISKLFLDSENEFSKPKPLASEKESEVAPAQQQPDVKSESADEVDSLDRPERSDIEKKLL